MFQTLILIFLTITCFCMFCQTVLSVKMTWKSLDPCKRTVFPLESRTSGDNGFRIKISGKPEPQLYQAEKAYTVTINGTFPNQEFIGVLLAAVPEGATDEETSMGHFQIISSDVVKADFCTEVILMQSSWHSKAAIDVLWIAPVNGSGCVEFRVTIIQDEAIWMKDDGALTRTLCESHDRL